MKIAGILLAAGRSTRFGDADKLMATLAGRPLLDHAAHAMRGVPLAMRFIVRPDGATILPGFTTLAVEAPAPGIGLSLATGVRAAREAGADAVLVTLADMPLVQASHLAALIARASRPLARLASSDGLARTPPALFGSHWFAELESLTGDEGARRLIADAEIVPAPPGTLRDIDTAADLAALSPAESTPAARSR